MRKVKLLIVMVLALMLALPALALAEYAGTASDTSGSPATVRLPADSNGRTRIVAYSLRSDAAAHTHDATVYYAAATYSQTAATTSGSQHVYVSVTGWSAGDIACLQDASGSTIHHYTVLAVNYDNIQVNSPPSSNLRAITTKVYRMTASAYIGMSGTSTAQTASNSTGVFIGPKNSPIIIVYWGGDIQYVTYKIF